MEKFQNFEEWCRVNHLLNWRENSLMMNSIDRILMVPNFEKISSVSILNQLLGALRNNVSFGSKAKTEQAKEIKVFKLYIQFKEEEKAKEAPVTEEKVNEASVSE
ncbi:MAG: hypothetical protein JWQ40_39 [Segetibacter sp.]|nr:hypothetical protein [Segetibacter sp.]